MSTISSNDALYICDESMTIVEWNAAAEQLTGVSAEQAVGEKCWRVIRGSAESGETVCHPGCSAARLSRQRWPANCGDLFVPTEKGRQLLHISTILVESGVNRYAVHPLHNGVELAKPEPPQVPSPLTKRQEQVLGLLAAGMRARAIAAELHLSEATVRNHLRGIRRELGVSSQVEGLARARQLGLVA